MDRSSLTADGVGADGQDGAVPSWVGHVNAKKPDMIAACRQRGWSPKDDNEADAQAVLAYGLWLEVERRRKVA